MNKQTILSKSFAALASFALLATAAHAATLVNGTSGAGELFVGFRATGGVGAGESVVIDLGSVSALSNAALGSTTSLGTYGADLVTKFGANWFNRSDVLWGAVAGVFSTATADPINSLYGGVKVASFNPSLTPTTTAYNRTTNSSQASIAQRILQNMATGAGGFTSATTGTTGTNVGLEGVSDAQSWKSWMAGGANVAGLGNIPFGGFGSPTAVNFEQAFGTGDLGFGAEGALDVYRMYRSTSADPDASPTTGTGAGSYQFTLAIGSGGSIDALVRPVAVPEPASIGTLTSAALLGIGAIRRKRAARA
jgi:hypothetical protein